MKKSGLFLTVGILVLFAGGYLWITRYGWWLVDKDVNSQSSIPIGWQKYANQGRRFSLFYPPALTIKEYDEGDGTYTLVFSEKTSGEKSKEFQIFFTPYPEKTITDSRIKKDLAGGQFTKPVEIIIGRELPALAFESGGAFGRLREVWFLRDGYLFEATANLEWDQWLSQIMATWQFF